MRIRAERLVDAPIIHPELHPSIGDNIQGPSLIRAPDWLGRPLGRYYLYFADHKGAYIRLAYADDLAGPWRVHEPGSLQLEQSHFPVAPPATDDKVLAAVRERMARTGTRVLHDLELELSAPHIASPDVHVDTANRRVVMYFHGLERFGYQCTRVATSPDGLAFQARPEVLGKTYFRAWDYLDQRYALAMPGQIYRSRDGLGDFEPGPTLFNPNMRHAALWLNGDELWVFWTQVGDVPERILLSIVDLRGDWMSWADGPPMEVLRPSREWEGASAPLEPSVRSVAYGVVNQLRDPAIFLEGEAAYLLYAVGGESGIGIARLYTEQDRRRS